MAEHNTLTESFTQDINNSRTLDELYEVKVKYLSKKGLITAMSKELPKLPPEDRPKFGNDINILKNSFIERYEARESALKDEEIQKKLESEKIDITMPGLNRHSGHLHPINIVYDEIVSIFTAMGYSLASGPEVESDYYAFEALNIPKGHPARDMQDTFYITDNLLLRPHTSPVQIRTMLKEEPPIKIISPGKTYRSDYDITHTPMFHQVEALYIDTNVTLGDLKGTLQHFVKQMFGNDIPVRFRSSYFPFTEPSMEVDMGCVNCNGSGCRVCKNTGWVEIGGSGMVAPEVFTAVNIDPNKYSGFAFGMGIERITMIKYKIDDLRVMFENLDKFLNQF